MEKYQTDYYAVTGTKEEKTAGILVETTGPVSQTGRIGKYSQCLKGEEA